jgi:hypothetical protein
MTNNELKFRTELIELMKRHGVSMTKSDVYYPRDSENISFHVPPDTEAGYWTSISVEDVAEWTGGWK